MQSMQHITQVLSVVDSVLTVRLFILWSLKRAAETSMATIILSRWQKNRINVLTLLLLLQLRGQVRVFFS
jgi:hypothetical protein